MDIKQQQLDLKKRFEANRLKISDLKKSIQAMHPLFNRGKIKAVGKQIQAIEEGQKDILSTSVLNRGIITTQVVNKNNYKTYDSQIRGAYDMYNCSADYGSELCKGIVDFRSAVIAGEGLSINSKNKKKLEFIENFLNYNNMHGSKLIDSVTTGELEGKCALLLGIGKNKLDSSKKEVKISIFSYYHNRYKVNLESNDTDIIKSITYQPKDEGATEDKTIQSKNCVYIKLGGMDFQINQTSNRLHAVLTDIENFSRAKYDLRENTHLFGKTTPYWHTETASEAKAINNDLQGDQVWQPGTGYAGSAQFSLVEPSGGAANAIKEDMLISLKNVSLTLGIPIHYLSWPELMSNRATADTLYEVIVTSTKKERLLWEEGLKELIDKAMNLAVNSRIAGNEILKDDYQLKLPVVSMSLLKQLIEVWYPLLSDSIISEFTFRNMLPGIDPTAEKKLVEKEKEERIKNSPMMNNTTGAFLQQQQNGDNQNDNNESADNQ